MSCCSIEQPCIDASHPESSRSIPNEDGQAERRCYVASRPKSTQRGLILAEMASRSTAVHLLRHEQNVTQQVVMLKALPEQAGNITAEWCNMYGEQIIQVDCNPATWNTGAHRNVSLRSVCIKHRVRPQLSRHEIPYSRGVTALIVSDNGPQGGLRTDRKVGLSQHITLLCSSGALTHVRSVAMV